MKPLALSFRRGLSLLSAFVVLVGWSAVARADIIIQSSDPAFAAAVEACLAKFLADGGETARIITTLEQSVNDHVIQASSSGSGTSYNNVGNANSMAAGGTGTGTGTTVDWDRSQQMADKGAAANDPCVVLLHELRHALDGDQGTRDPRPKPPSGIKNNEIEASKAENRYRKARAVPQRQQYDGKTLPPETQF